MRRELRILELSRWAERDERRQSTPFIMTEAMRRYKISSRAAKSYAKEVYERLQPKPITRYGIGFVPMGQAKFKIRFIKAKDLKKA